MPLGLAALAGFVWAVVAAARGRRLPLLLITVWPALYLLEMGTYVGRFIRYLLPLVPFCCLCAAGGVWALRGWLRAHAPWGAGAARALLVLDPPVAGAAGWGLSMLAIYTRLDTRLAATAWIYANVPRGSAWLQELSYQLLPLPDAVYSRRTGIRPAFCRSPAPTARASPRLTRPGSAASGNLELPDRRWSAVLPRLPNFPQTARFDAQLFAGQLGYVEVARFTSPPQSAPGPGPTTPAEETFQVFDHPTVRIDRNAAHLSTAELQRRLTGPVILPPPAACPTGRIGTAGVRKRRATCAGRRP